MRIDIIRYETRVLSSKHFQFFAQQFLWFYSYEVDSSSDVRKKDP